MHKFKSKQFYMFTVQPWSLVEQTEEWGVPEAEAVKLARDVGKTGARVACMDICAAESALPAAVNERDCGECRPTRHILLRHCAPATRGLSAADRRSVAAADRIELSPRCSSWPCVCRCRLGPRYGPVDQRSGRVGCRGGRCVCDRWMVDEAAADEAAVVDAVAAVAQIPAVATAEATRETTEDHSVESAPASQQSVLPSRSCLLRLPTVFRIGTKA